MVLGVNHFHEIDFEREVLERGLRKLSQDQGWKKKVAESTIKRDVACFIRTYAAQPILNKTTYEDAIESPLTELGLLNQIGRRDKFRFVRGPKRTLGIGAFGYAVAEFWRDHFDESATLAFDSFAHQPSSPGRVFLLDENSLYNLCGQLEEVSGGIYRWSETAGLRQMVRTERLDKKHDFEYAFLGLQVGYRLKGNTMPLANEVSVARAFQRSVRVSTPTYPLLRHLKGFVCPPVIRERSANYGAAYRGDWAGSIHLDRPLRFRQV